MFTKAYLKMCQEVKCSKRSNHPSIHHTHKWLTFKKQLTRQYWHRTVCAIHLHITKKVKTISVADPDLSVPYAYVTPGSESGSISQRYGSGTGSGGIILSSSKNSKKNLNSYCSVTSLWLLYLQKVKSRKTFLKISFLLASWRSITLNKQKNFVLN